MVDATDRDKRQAARIVSAFAGDKLSLEGMEVRITTALATARKAGREEAAAFCDGRATDLRLSRGTRQAYAFIATAIRALPDTGG